MGEITKEQIEFSRGVGDILLGISRTNDVPGGATDRCAKEVTDTLSAALRKAGFNTYTIVPEIRRQAAAMRRGKKSQG